MQSREPSMEDILASIKRVIAEEKELRAAVPPSLPDAADEDEDVLELDESMAAVPASEQQQPADLGPPLLDEEVAGSSREKLEQLSTLAASAPPQSQANPLEEMLREMLRPVLKQWLDENLPRIVDEHVKREISRITGRPL
jgi:cell pole-organizing protein PopZ